MRIIGNKIESAKTRIQSYRQKYKIRRRNPGPVVRELQRIGDSVQNLYTHITLHRAPRLATELAAAVTCCLQTETALKAVRIDLEQRGDSVEEVDKALETLKLYVHEQAIALIRCVNTAQHGLIRFDLIPMAKSAGKVLTREEISKLLADLATEGDNTYE